MGHAGAVLLHKLADRVGLSEALGRLWPHRQSATWRDRAHVLVSLATAIACGARSLLEAERLQAHQAATCRPGWPPTPAATCASNRPGPGPKPSSWPGSASPTCPLSPESRA
ncbi:hypothetical protein [Nonomuraea sp. NPDC050202]|uniref:hypothetical protein n=1 Tax=Nonomuraea sp. NPDC050202 TaxID=3155035 RepID=UPI0033FF4F12